MPYGPAPVCPPVLRILSGGRDFRWRRTVSKMRLSDKRRSLPNRLGLACISNKYRLLYFFVSLQRTVEAAGCGYATGWIEKKNRKNSLLCAFFRRCVAKMQRVDGHRCTVSAASGNRCFRAEGASLWVFPSDGQKNGGRMRTFGIFLAALMMPEFYGSLDRGATFPVPGAPAIGARAVDPKPKQAQRPSGFFRL